VSRKGDSKSAETKRHEHRMRQRGYADGLARREPAYFDRIYMTSYRRGQERADEVKEERSG
jgi:hypothetical protein